MNDLPYHLALNGQSAGPFTLAQVQEMWKTGQVSAQTLYWQEGLANWQPLGQIAAAFGDAPPPLRPPAMPGVPAPYYPAGTMMPIGAPPTSGLAIASLVLGVLSLIIVVTCLPAIICGHLALSQIKQSAGRLGGRGMAITGLVTGYFFIALLAGIFMIGILAGIALPVFNSVQQRGKATGELAHGKQIALAIRLYEIDNDGKTPPDLAALSPTYLSDQSIFRSSLNPLDPSPAFDYLTPNIKGDDLPPHTLILRGRFFAGQHQRVYIYSDATGELKRDP